MGVEAVAAVVEQVGLALRANLAVSAGGANQLVRLGQHAVLTLPGD